MTTLLWRRNFLDSRPLSKSMRFWTETGGNLDIPTILCVSKSRHTRLTKSSCQPRSDGYPGLMETMTPVALRSFIASNPNFQFCSVIWADNVKNLHEVNPYTNMFGRIGNIFPPNGTTEFDGVPTHPTRYAIAFTRNPLIESLFPSRVWENANISTHQTLVVLPCIASKVIELATLIEMTVLKNFEKQEGKLSDHEVERHHAPLIRSIVSIKNNFR